MEEQLASAKINLYLHITGKRDDGYHLLDSLIAFTGYGDRLSVTAANNTTFSVSGDFAAGIKTISDEDNLVVQAYNLFFDMQKMAAIPAVIHLEKKLPLSSGMGGGSADAAAMLRLLSRHYPCPAPLLHDMAIKLGADVPVCLSSRPQRIQGIGDKLLPAPTLPPCYAVLVNPVKPLPTAQVFKTCHAPFSSPVSLPERFENFDNMIAFLKATRNDLSDAAATLVPDIAKILSTLEQIETCALARLSGSGATCFGLFERQHHAEQAAEHIRQTTGWWAVATNFISA